VKSVRYYEGSPKNKRSPLIKHQAQGSLGSLQSNKVNLEINFLQFFILLFFAQKKPQDSIFLLDIEGESKPLNKKGKKDNIS